LSAFASSDGDADNLYFQKSLDELGLVSSKGLLAAVERKAEVKRRRQEGGTDQRDEWEMIAASTRWVGRYFLFESEFGEHDSHPFCCFFLSQAKG
jgi:hypothetical protein